MRSSKINFSFFLDIENQIKDIQEKKKQNQAQEERSKGIGLLESGYFDSDIYDESQKDKNKKYEGYVTSIATNEDDDDDEEEQIRPDDKRISGFNAPSVFLNEISRVSIRLESYHLNMTKLIFFQSEPDYDPFADTRRKTVGEKEDEYRQKRRKIAAISPERVDPFADGKCHHNLIFIKV